VDDAELVGGVLFRSSDPWEASRELAVVLKDSYTSAPALRALGLDPHLVDVLRSKLGSDTERVDRACALGAAWASGRNSVAEAQPWEVVATLPTLPRLPGGLRRTTGETLVQLINEATRTLRLAAPFIDESGMSYLKDALLGAASRDVSIEILLPTRSTHAGAALGDLEGALRSTSGAPGARFARMRDDAPWVHLKAVTADGHAAYIGSANFTGPGLSGGNLELGILVRGPSVATIDRVLDLFRE
jgi:phosphatidylserine/phosphatidylglycerophosphate/cardiolipin synthase-like enzyme